MLDTLTRPRESNPMSEPIHYSDDDHEADMDLEELRTEPWFKPGKVCATERINKLQQRIAYLHRQLRDVVAIEDAALAIEETTRLQRRLQAAREELAAYEHQHDQRN